MRGTDIAEYICNWLRSDKLYSRVSMPNDMEAKTESFPKLTVIEVRILAELARGLQSKEIARQLGRSRPTVEGHIRILYAKFAARSRAHLVASALRCGALNEDHF